MVCMEDMNRRSFMRSGLKLIGLASAATLFRPGGSLAERGSADLSGSERLEKSLAEWKELLPPDAFGVLFKENTERPFSSPLNEEERKGLFICAACHLPLFESEAKFESGTGWPSFWTPIKGRVATKKDFRLVLPRTEYHCARCSGHQGHVFADGPEPTGERWCNNGLALRFIPTGTALPELRT